MNRFEYTDAHGDTFAAAPTTLRDGTPILAVRITEYDNAGPTNSAVVHLPTAFLEEVIAGLRDMARQAAGQTPALAGLPITDEQRALAAAVLPPGARVTAAALNAAEGAGA
ncbi:hypothetical protein ACIQWN_28780 [Streptomyces vinaceus]|uniref:hypothetical protein n=1 Tax=Streptomyces vinaceus TaxID=1960 RepID=UPI0038137EC0